jgi:hypothetical protein
MREVTRYSIGALASGKRQQTRSGPLSHTLLTDIYNPPQKGPSFSGSVNHEYARQNRENLKKERNDPLKGAFIDIIEDPDQAKDVVSGVLKKAARDRALNHALTLKILELASILSTPVPDTEEAQVHLEFLFKHVIDKAGVSAGKMCQILSDDPEIPLYLRELMTTIKSQGIPSRTVEEAQEYCNRIFTHGHYHIVKNLGCGTVGEAWLAQKNDGDSYCVIKLLKTTVSGARLKQEQRIWHAFIESIYTEDEKLRKKALRTIDQLFAGWRTELDFDQEKNGAINLSKRSKRYQVALPEAVGKIGETSVCLVYSVAPGIQLDKLVEMLSVYKLNPAVYTDIYATEIKAFPPLGSPEDWIKDLPQTYLAAQNEQALFLRNGKNKERTSHGDPHTGNIFLHFGKNNKLILTYIDTGLTVTREPVEVICHLGVFLDGILGNSRRLALQLIESAQELPTEYKGRRISRNQLIDLLAEKIETGVYNSTSSQQLDLAQKQKVFDKILDELDIIPNPGNIVFLKAQLQTYLTYRQLSNVVGQPDNNMFVASSTDMAEGLLRGLRTAPLETIITVSGSVAQVFENPALAWKRFQDFINSGNAKKK